MYAGGGGVANVFLIPFRDGSRIDPERLPTIADVVVKPHQVRPRVNEARRLGVRRSQAAPAAFPRHAANTVLHRYGISMRFGCANANHKIIYTPRWESLSSLSSGFIPLPAGVEAADMTGSLQAMDASR